MNKNPSFESTPSENLPEVFVIGGTFGPKRSYHMYQPLLDSFSNGSVIPARERFLELKDLGLGHASDTRDDLETRIEPLVDELIESGKPLPIFAGHSQGALYASYLASKYGSGAILLGGLNVGMNESHPTSKALKKIVGNTPAATDLVMGSEFMKNHLKYMQTNMPSNVRVHAIAPTYDEVLGMKPQFGLKLPDDHEQPIEWWDCPAKISLGRMAIRRSTGVPETAKNLYSKAPSEHLSIVFSSGVRWLINGLREEVQNAHETTRVA